MGAIIRAEKDKSYKTSRGVFFFGDFFFRKMAGGGVI